MLKLYDTKELVPDAQRDAAIETKDGKWAAEDGAAVGDGGKKAIDAERARAEAAERDAATHKAELERLKREAKARERGASEEELERIRKEEEAARKPILDENEELKKQNRQLRLTDNVKALFLHHGGLGEPKKRLDQAMRELETRTDLGDKGGIVFKDEKGDVTADDAEAFFKKFKLECPWFFRGSGSSGGGSTGSDGSDIPPAGRGSNPAGQQRARDIAGSF